MSGIRRSSQKFIVIAAAVLVAIVIAFFSIASLVLEPMLKKRLHALIIDGSDSLYHYSLGAMQADVFGANVTVHDLKVWVDSTRFRQKRRANTLPAITVNLDMKQGQVRGISLLSLLAGNKLKIREVNTGAGSLGLSRFYAQRGSVQVAGGPFWKAIRPTMKGIDIGQIKLDNMQFAYWDLGPKDLLFQFSRLDALLQDIKIDSAMLADTSRFGYLRSLSFSLQNMTFLSADSVYKLDVGTIRYTSADRELEVDRFQLQPSNSFDQLLRLDTVGKTYFSLQTEKMRFRNLRLEQFINSNVIRADSMVVQSPVVKVYFDRSAPKNMRSKVGNFPHQLIAKAPMELTIHHLLLGGLQMSYTEKSDRTEKVARVDLNDITIAAENLTNEPGAIRANPVCTIHGDGAILGSPISTRFRMYLDAANGQFDVEGKVKNMTAVQLNPLAESFASVRLNSLNIDEVNFSITGNDSVARGLIRMRYNGIDVAVLKANPLTGDMETRRFMTNIVNKYMVHPANPGADGYERVEENATINRLLSHSFFGLIWKTIFIGMQNIILKT